MSLENKLAITTSAIAVASGIYAGYMYGTPLSPEHSPFETQQLLFAGGNLAIGTFIMIGGQVFGKEEVDYNIDVYTIPLGIFTGVLSVCEYMLSTIGGQALSMVVQ